MWLSLLVIDSYGAQHVWQANRQLFSHKLLVQVCFIIDIYPEWCLCSILLTVRDAALKLCMISRSNGQLGRRNVGATSWFYYIRWCACYGWWRTSCCYWCRTIWRWACWAFRCSALGIGRRASRSGCAGFFAAVKKLAKESLKDFKTGLQSVWKYVRKWRK